MLYSVTFSSQACFPIYFSTTSPFWKGTFFSKHTAKDRRGLFVPPCCMTTILRPFYSLSYEIWILANWLFLCLTHCVHMFMTDGCFILHSTPCIVLLPIVASLLRYRGGFSSCLSKWPSLGTWLTLSHCPTPLLHYGWRTDIGQAGWEQAPYYTLIHF